MYCIYCGSPQGERLSCCGEVHFVTAAEYKEYTGEWPDDGEEHDEVSE